MLEKKKLEFELQVQKLELVAEDYFTLVPSCSKSNDSEEEVRQCNSESTSEL